MTSIQDNIHNEKGKISHFLSDSRPPNLMKSHKNYRIAISPVKAVNISTAVIEEQLFADYLDICTNAWRLSQEQTVIRQEPFIIGVTYKPTFLGEITLTRAVSR